MPASTASSAKAIAKRKCPQCHNKKTWNAGLCKKCHQQTVVINRRQVSEPTWRKIILVELRLRDGNSCGYCGYPFEGVEVHIDHIKPMSVGGTNELSNFVLACEFCNMAKQDNEVEHFLKWLSHIRSGYFECRAKPIRELLMTLDSSISDKLQKSWWEDE